MPITLTVLLSHMCDTPVLTTSAIDSPITCIKILNLKGLAKAEVLSYIVPGMQVATD